MRSLVDQAEENLSGRKIEEVLGDGAFDRREIFDHLQQKGIQPIIKIRSNANTKAGGNKDRKYDARSSSEVCIL